MRSGPRSDLRFDRSPSEFVPTQSDVTCVGVTQVIELKRPTDSRLEHVDFDSLFSCLGVRQVVRVFASLLLERRVIFVAEKLR